LFIAAFVNDVINRKPMHKSPLQPTQRYMYGWFCYRNTVSARGLLWLPGKHPFQCNYWNVSIEIW